MGAAEKLDQKFTYADYLTWEDGKQWELIEGIPYCMSPSPSTIHQRVSNRLGFILNRFFWDKPCQVFAAPIDVVLPDQNETSEADYTTLVQPDILLICDKQKIKHQSILGAPKWVVEILSPNSSKRDIQTKYALYEKHKVEIYWIVHPIEEVIYVYELNKNGKYEQTGRYAGNDIISVSQFEGLKVDLEELFAEQD